MLDIPAGRMSELGFERSDALIFFIPSPPLPPVHPPCRYYPRRSVSMRDDEGCRPRSLDSSRGNLKNAAEPRGSDPTRRSVFAQRRLRHLLDELENRTRVGWMTGIPDNVGNRADCTERARDDRERTARRLDSTEIRKTLNSSPRIKKKKGARWTEKGEVHLLSEIREKDGEEIYARNEIDR